MKLLFDELVSTWTGGGGPSLSPSHAPTGNQTSLLSTRRMRVLRCWSFARLLEIIIPRIYTPLPRCINDSYVRLPMLHAGENSFGPARGCLLLLFEHATPPPSFFPSHLFLPLCAFNPRFFTFYRILFFLAGSRLLLTIFIIHLIQFRGGTSFLGG